MSKSGIYISVIIVIIIVLLLIWWIWMSFLPASSPPATTNVATLPDTIQIGQNSTIGSFLTDANGKTLYYFANDKAGISNCTGQCQTIWPAFYTAGITVPDGLNSADFGSVAASSATKQTTYKDWPLYYYSGDTKPGDTNGDGMQKIWFIAKIPFYNVLIMNNSTDNSYLATSAGTALYYNSNDTKGTSTTNPVSKCDATCMGTDWTSFDQPQLIVPSLLNSGDFQEFTNADNQTQLAYKGRPLYQYSEDSVSGDANGNGLNKIWHLVQP